jgi:hypothetical protein
MIALRQPLKLEQRDADTCLILWLCEMFDPNYSFRVALSEIERELSAAGPASHALPPEEPEEDFVFGRFTWDGREFALYYERSLGYMQFSSSSATDVQALHAALSPVAEYAKA